MRYNISNKYKQMSLEVWFGAILHTEIEKQFHTEIAGEFYFWVSQCYTLISKVTCVKAELPQVEFTITWTYFTNV